MFIYRQSTGELSREGQVLAVGYSGAGEGKNNVEYEQVPKVGPIPRGTYTIGPTYLSPTMGPITMQLFPAPTNNM